MQKTERELACKICFEKYNAYGQMPVTLMMCGHTFCLKCMNELKRQPKYVCPTCRDDILATKPNYAVLETIDSHPNVKYTLSKSTVCISQNLKPDQKYFSSNHVHPFVKLNSDSGWICDGADLFGKCKSGFDSFSKSFGKERFKCSTCANFDLCRECLTAPLVQNQEIFSKNHPHPFIKVQTSPDQSWSCDGGSIYGKCKSGRDTFKKNSLQVRYQCKTCNDFDLCHECMHAPKTESFTMPYHPHEFIKFERDNGWQCNGASIFGKCKSGLDEFKKSFGFKRYRCTVCSDFDLCYECLNSIKKSDLNI